MTNTATENTARNNPNTSNDNRGDIIADREAVETQAKAVMDAQAHEIRTAVDKQTTELRSMLADIKEDVARKRGKGKTVGEVVRSQFGDDAELAALLAALNEQTREAEKAFAEAANTKIVPYVKLSWKEALVVVLTSLGTGMAAGIGGSYAYNVRKARKAAAASDSSSMTPEPSTGA